MGKTNRIRSKKRVGLGKIFQEFKEDEAVAVVKEPSIASSFPLRLQGLTGTVGKKRGRSYMIEIKTQNKIKNFLIDPVHLKRIKLVK